MSTPQYESDKFDYQERYFTASATGRCGVDEEIRTTPIFSLAVKYLVDPPPTATPDASLRHRARSQSSGSSEAATSSGTPAPLCEEVPSQLAHDGRVPAPGLLPQYGLLGFHIGQDEGIGEGEPFMLNVDAPNSTFICGSQGSGKSYSLSCMLENFLLRSTEAGNVDSPVAGVVFHYDLDGASSVAEVAHLCSQGVAVRVLVSQSNRRKLEAAYHRIAGPHGNLTVQPLLLRSADLSIERMNKLMALAEKEGPAPLYMEVVQRILRQMAIDGKTPFDYKYFRRQLAEENLSKDQTNPMNLRFGLLESFMHPADVPCAPGRPTTKRAPAAAAAAASGQRLFDLHHGSLTIVDLSDPFLDASTVCLLFDICLGLIQERRPRGLVVALDEAHKFMNKSAAAAAFTDRLLTTIREQRHNATRVVIATQEPTVDPKLLDLCSTSIVHRFSSPAWFDAIRDHLAGASRMLAGPHERRALFDAIVHLDVGESLVFCPWAFVKVDHGAAAVARRLGAGAMKMKTRARTGADGGVSVLASRAPPQQQQQPPLALQVNDERP